MGVFNGRLEGGYGKFVSGDLKIIDFAEVLFIEEVLEPRFGRATFRGGSFSFGGCRFFVVYSP